MLKKTPFCRQCKYYGGKTICLHPKAEGKQFEHIKPDFWCRYGVMKDKEVKHDA